MLQLLCVGFSSITIDLDPLWGLHPLMVYSGVFAQPRNDNARQPQSSLRGFYILICAASDNPDIPANGGGLLSVWRVWVIVFAVQHFHKVLAWV